MKKLAWIALLGAVALAMTCQEPGPTPEEQLQAIFDESWEFQMREFPTYATAVGIHDYNDKLTSMTLADIERRAQYWQEILQRLEAIDREALSTEAQINFDMFTRRVEDRVQEFEFKDHLIPITAEGGFHTGFARLAERVPLATPQDYENYIARLAAFGQYADEYMTLLREGVANGYVLPRVTLEGYDSTIRPHVMDDVTQSVFWKPFADFPNTVPEADRERLRESGLAAIRDTVIPAYRTFLAFMLDEYIPACRNTLGASELPNGREYYAYLVRHHTTLDITPEEVHEIGLAEVARIRGEMMEIIEELGFEGDFADFLEFLRTDS